MWKIGTSLHRPCKAASRLLTNRISRWSFARRSASDKSKTNKITLITTGGIIGTTIGYLLFDKYGRTGKNYEVDVVIVGGGVVGCSIAYHLRQLKPNAKVTLLEENILGSGATVMSAATIYCETDNIEQASKNVDNFKTYLCSGTVNIIDKLQNKDGFNCDFKQTGGLLIATNKNEKEYLIKLYKNIINKNDETTFKNTLKLLTNINDIKKLEPNINENIVTAALYTPLSGSCDPQLLIESLVRGTMKNKTINSADNKPDHDFVFRENCKVVNIHYWGSYLNEIKNNENSNNNNQNKNENKKKAEKFEIITENGDHYLTKRLVLANGANGNDDIRNWLGIEIPIKKVKGYIWYVNHNSNNKNEKNEENQKFEENNGNSEKRNQNKKKNENENDSNKNEKNESILHTAIFPTQSYLYWEQNPTLDWKNGIPNDLTHDINGNELTQHGYAREFDNEMTIFGGSRILCNQNEKCKNGQSNNNNDTTDNHEELADHNTLEAKKAIASNFDYFSKMFPILKEKYGNVNNIDGYWYGIMPFTMDGKPFIGNLREIGFDRLWIANGFGPRGIMTAPMAGYVIAKSIVDAKEFEMDCLKSCRPYRTGGVTLAAPDFTN